MKMKSESEVAQSCPTLSDSMGCSLPGSSVHGIFQAKVLEWVAIAFSEEKSISMLFILLAMQTVHGGPMVGTPDSQCRSLSLIPDLEAGSHMPQLKTPSNYDTAQSNK